MARPSRQLAGNPKENLGKWWEFRASMQLPPCAAHCKGKEPAALGASGPVAQWLEPTAHNGLVAGSSPAGPTNNFNDFLLSTMSFYSPVPLIRSLRFYPARFSSRKLTFRPAGSTGTG